MTKTIVIMFTLSLLLLDLYCTAEILLEKDKQRADKYCKAGLLLSLCIMAICIATRFTK